MSSYRRKLLLSIIFLLPLLFILSQCFNFKKAGEDPRGPEYAGAAACVSCHKAISNSSMHTAHFMASQPASANSIDGNFNNGYNQFVFNSHLTAVMDKRDSGFYQTSYVDGRVEESQRFDIVFGGVKGQSYAYWFANMLFQLPISTSSRKWINSPGYDPGRMAFDRPINTQCLGCHLSYAKNAPPAMSNFYDNVEGFEKTSLLYSVDCERCHGPAAEHVKFQTDNPNEKKAKFIVSFNSLTREQKINMCAVCHSGAANQLLKPTFGFKPGDTLSKFMVINTTALPSDYRSIDVHGNQRALLASSKCFMNSQMVCSTCHNTHVNDRNNVTLYAAKCLTCHSDNTHIKCKVTGKLSEALLVNNCIACHLPAFASKNIIAGQAPTLVHTHHIGIYPEETQKVKDYLKVKFN